MDQPVTMQATDSGSFVAVPPARTILGADFGSVHTRVIFIDQVGGQYRLVARAQALTTADPPFGDVTIGLIRALDQITNLIGRQFMAGDQIAIGSGGPVGADQFVATASGGRPMRAVLVGLMPDVSMASGRAALASVYVDRVDEFSVGDLRSEEEQVNTLLNKRPDLIFIVGGTDNGASETMLTLMRTVRLAVSLLPIGERPVVLYAGNDALLPQVRALFQDEVELFTASNVRPTLEVERLDGAQLELAVAYGTFKANTGGYKDLLSLSRLGVLPTANSYINIMRYLGELAPGGLGAFLVDVGSSTLTLAATLQKRPFISIRPDLGLGHSASIALERVGAEAVLRWLSFKATADDILNYVNNKTLSPSTIPQTPEELEIEFALTRVMVSYALDEFRQTWGSLARSVLLPHFTPIIGTGAVFTQGVDPGLSAMLLLDSLQPTGVVSLKLDSYGIIAALGAAAYLTPLAVVQVLDSGGLLDLGMAICPEGQTRDNDAMEITIKYGSGRTTSRIVPNNSFRLIELSNGQSAQITVKLANGLSVDGRRNLSMEVRGGAAGLICDTRGRPLRLPPELARRSELLGRWYASARAGSSGAQTMPVEAVGPDAPLDAAPPAPPLPDDHAVPMTQDEDDLLR
jgi:hypothetical protein